MSGRCLKRPTQIALTHFVWHFEVGKPWDSTTIIDKKLCLGSTRRFHIYIYIYVYIYINIFILVSPIGTRYSLVILIDISGLLKAFLKNPWQSPRTCEKRLKAPRSPCKQPRGDSKVHFQCAWLQAIGNRQ